MKTKSSLYFSLLATAVCFAACGDDDGGSAGGATDTEATDTEDASVETGDTDADETDESDPTDPATDDDETDSTDATETDVTETDVTDAETDSTDEMTDVDEPDGGAMETDDDEDEEGLIGAAGGTLSNSDGVMLQVPPDSIDPPSVLTVGEVDVDTEQLLVSLAWDFQPDGVTFDPPAMLTIPFDVDAVEGDVVIAWLDDGEWMPLSDCVVDDDMVTCPVEHFTTFGVIELEADEVDGGTMETDGTDTMETDMTETDGTDTMETDTTETDVMETDDMTDVTDPVETDTGTCEGPPCWTDIDFEDCIPDEVASCQSTFQDMALESINTCYANGVKAQLAGFLAEPMVMSVKKADGASCYSMETWGAQTSTYSYVWKNAAGAEVMTATVQASNPDVVTYQCNGTQYVVDYSTEACASEPAPADSDTQGCAQGTCTF